MMKARYLLSWRAAFLLGMLALVPSCDDELDVDFARPSEPLETTIFDLVDGPIDRASAFDVVAGRGRGAPRAVRVDRSGQWDLVFAVRDSEPVWLPRGFFESNEPSSGILELDRSFDEVEQVPDDPEQYEQEDPVPVKLGGVYAVRSRNDPALSLPCRVFAKLGVLAIGSDPVRVEIEYLWNPNCDDPNVSPGQ